LLSGGFYDMSAKNIRDLLVGPPHPSESVTIHTVAKETVKERTVVPDETSKFTARLPGDENDHPLAEVGKNPFPGVSVLALSRMLRDGTMPPDKERQARAYLSQHQRLTGEVMYDRRNHEPDHPTEQQYADGDTRSPAQSGGLRRADPFDSGRNFQLGGRRVR
jgi:hypothetical protein